MNKKSIFTIVAIAMVALAILVTGCISNSDYGPVVKLNVTAKYLASNGFGTDKMVCTTLGTYKVYGPMYGDGKTTASEDMALWSAMPLNQEINVRLYGDKLWWVDWNGNKCCSSSCSACVIPTPTPTSMKCYTATCNCGCSP